MAVWFVTVSLQHMVLATFFSKNVYKLVGASHVAALRDIDWRCFVLFPRLCLPAVSQFFRLPDGILAGDMLPDRHQANGIRRKKKEPKIQNPGYPLKGAGHLDIGKV